MCEGWVSVRAMILVRNMAHSNRTLRIGIASVIAVLMVVGAYGFSGPNPLFNINRIAEAQSSEELLREYAAKDSDSDGLPDWQEALYGTDPLNPESFQEGILDGDAVSQGLVEPKVRVTEPNAETDIESIPGITPSSDSLTDRFSRELLTQYLSNRGTTAPTSAEIISFVEKGIQNLKAEAVSPPRYTLADVSVAGGVGAQSLQTYAAEAETAFAQNTVSADKNELSYFADALKDDAAALEKIEDISAAYANIAAAMIEISVPNEARQAHLTIVNALIHMSEASADMAALKTDPVRALLGIGLYASYAQELVSGFANLSGVFTARQVVVPVGTAGHSFISTAESATAQ